MAKNIYLVVTSFFPSPTFWRGAFVYDFVKALMRSGEFTVVVFMPCRFGQKVENYAYGGVQVVGFPHVELPSNLLPGLFGWLNGWLFRRAVRRAGIDFRDVAVCHLHGVDDVIYGMKRRFPRVMAVRHYHGRDVFGLKTGRFNRRFAWHRNWTVRHLSKIRQDVDLHVCVSGFVERDLKQFPQCKDWRTYVLHNGVDTSQFNFVTSSGKQKSARDFTIGCVGNFNRTKGQMVLLRAVNRLVRGEVAMDASARACKLCVIFIGSGPCLEECKNYASANGLAQMVEFKSEVDHSALPDFYRSLDLFVLPSEDEAFGCVYTEAWACGTPFICVKGQGVSEIIPVEDLDKWAIAPGDDAGLASLIAANVACMVGAKAKGTNPQRLTESICIDVLVHDFLNAIHKQL